MTIEHGQEVIKPKKEKNIPPASMYIFNDFDSGGQGQEQHWEKLYRRYKRSNDLLEKKFSFIIKAGIRDKRIDIICAAAKMIPLVPKNEQDELKRELVPVIRNRLNHNDIDVRLIAIEMIPLAPESEQDGLRKKINSTKDEPNNVDQNIDQNDMDISKLTPLALQSKKSKAEIAPDAEIVSISHPLYDEAPQNFFRTNFKKDHSQTTLLGESGGQSLKDKAIIRHIPLPSYLAWKKAFEDYQFWQEKGFNYVPIEPILSVAPRKDSWTVDAYAQVLGSNVSQWLKENSGHFEHQIKEQQEKIKEGLKELGIDHRHLHDRNFCLIFKRNNDGAYDYASPPRVYAIDFDVAENLK